MSNKKQLWEKQVELMAVHEKVKEHLKKIPGIINVGIGFREKGGKQLREICFRVYVEQKKDLSEINPDEIVPIRIEGFLTDVLTMPTGTLLANDDSERPIMGGIQLSVSGKKGTLGCFATRVENGDTVILSNYHVLYGFPKTTGGAVINHANDGDEVYQHTKRCCCCCRFNVAGTNVKGRLTNLVDAGIAKVTGVDRIAKNYLVTNFIKGLGELQTDGTFTNDNAPIRGVALRQAQTKAGVTVFATVAIGERVRKVGRATGRTFGEITNIDAAKTIGIKDEEGNFVPIHTFSGGQITIAPQNTSEEFAKKGDSGSVLINDNNEVVGLIIASVEGTTPDTTYANDIHNVLQELNIRIFAPPIADISADVTSGSSPLTVNFSGSNSQDTDGTIHYYAWDSGDPHPDTGAIPTGAGVTFRHTFTRDGLYKVLLVVTDNNGMSGRASIDIQVGTTSTTVSTATRALSREISFQGTFKTPEKILGRIQKSLGRTESGKAFLDKILQHQDEVLFLINHRRPVTLTWHRKQGPPFLAAIFATARDEGKIIPESIQGVNLPSLLRNMSVLLEDHGSKELVKDVQRYTTRVLQIAEKGKSLDDFINMISKIE